MAPPTRPSLSIAMPSGFESTYNNGPALKTPEHQDEQQSAAVPPPPPPRTALKVKKKRAGIPFEIPDISPDTVIPTIEMSQPVSETSSPITGPAQPMDGLLSPLTMSQRLYTPPTTPAAQVDVYASYDSPATEWAMINDSCDQKQAFPRADSVYSGFSNSSTSSAGSSGFSVPMGESCTSPESEANDPFVEDDNPKVDKMIFSPRSAVATPSNKRVKRTHKKQWTPAMDKHLERTYMTYVRDPKVTPFKMLPGSVPPLGVCHRVTDKVKRTWAQGQCRAMTPTQLSTILESEHQGSPATIRAGGTEGFKPAPSRWPRSNGSTRNRLRYLVKSKPELSVYYQRLLRTRSPSPLTSSSSTSSSSDVPILSFSSSDMKMSLITSTAVSMQPDGPLAQLAGEDTAMQQGDAHMQSQREFRPEGWFDRIPRSKAQQTSRDVLSALSETDAAPSVETDRAETTGLLASPFDEEASNRLHLLHSMSTTKSLGRNKFQRQNSKVPSLDSPFQMPAAPSLPRSLKRRFKSDEEKPARPGLEDVFGAPAEEASTVRHRAFSMGAVRATSNLARMFEPAEALPTIPSTTPADASDDEEMTEAPQVPAFPELGLIGSYSAPRRLADPVPRLGSPFSANSAGNHSNTFPRSYIPTLGNPQPFSDRLRELARQGRQN